MSRLRWLPVAIAVASVVAMASTVTAQRVAPAAWGGWLAVGLMLLLWQLRAHGWEREYARLMAASRQTRTKSGVRPPSGVRRAPKAPPVDAFGELEALLEPAPTTGALSRRPGD